MGGALPSIGRTPRPWREARGEENQRLTYTWAGAGLWEGGWTRQQVSDVPGKLKSALTSFQVLASEGQQSKQVVWGFAPSHPWLLEAFLGPWLWDSCSSVLLVAGGSPGKPKLVVASKMRRQNSWQTVTRVWLSPKASL